MWLCVGQCLCICADIIRHFRGGRELFQEVLGGDAEGNHRFNWVKCKGINSWIMGKFEGVLGGVFVSEWRVCM